MKETPAQGGAVCREGLVLKFCINLINFFLHGPGNEDSAEVFILGLLLSCATKKGTSFLLDLPIYKTEL